MTTLAYTRRGTGPTLVLLHGIGGSQQVWNPVLPELAEQFDVLVVDLPGFGESEPLPSIVEPSPAALAQRVAELLDDLGVDAPHVVGNSLGGWVALELAGLRRMQTVTLLSPAGLWRNGTPRYCWFSLTVSRWLTVHARKPLLRLVRSRWGRALVLGQTHGRPFRMSAEAAASAVLTMGSCPGFDAAFLATRSRHYVAGSPPLDAPVSVAFGSRDRLLLPRQSRHLDELPGGVRLEVLPRCGHVPMADDPAAVVAFITASAARDRSGSPASQPSAIPGARRPTEPVTAA